ncbi:MAG: dephospho-CoA kinase [Lachnospiraceae bacterium]|nr:dephospho-CoA kinase [Lachnospiraceae bacterium]
MRIIGITGGVGAGKSALLSYIERKYNCRIILADEVAHMVKEPGQECYRKLIALLGEEILNGDGSIDKSRMAKKIFADGALLEQVNVIIHPAVKAYILQEIAKCKEEGRIDFLFVEAALLIEDGYEKILDEIWYVHAKPDIRRERLKASRAYSDEKIDQIMQEQLTEDEFRKCCHVVIDNSEDIEHACKQIDKKLEEYLCQR